MRRSILPLLLLLSSCAPARPAPTSPRPPLRLVGEIGEPARRGEPLVTLAGGALTSPLVVPLWFDLDTADDADREKCGMSYEVSFVELEGGGIYVDQHNPYCGGDACRVFDEGTHAFVVPEGGCIPTANMPMHKTVDAWGRGVVVVRGSSEGVGAALVGTYSRAAGFRRLLSVDLGHNGTLEGAVTDEGIELRSPCPLLEKGCAFEVDYTGAPVRSYLLRDGQLTAK